MTMTPTELTQLVENSFDGPGGDRLKTVMRAIVRHAHACVEEIEPTHQEWLAAIQFLVAVGQFTDEKRNEMILLSDSLGISAMIDLLSDRTDPRQTSTTGLGPFYIADQDILPNGASIIRSDVPGEQMLFTGHVTDVEGAPMANIPVDVWQAHKGGAYDIQEGTVPNMRARFLTNESGHFQFISVLPTGYPLPPDGPVRPVMDALKAEQMRPAHIHTMLHRPAGPPKVTHLFFPGDPYLKRDAVYGVRSDLMLDVKKVKQPDGSEPVGITGPYHHAQFTFHI